MEEIRKCRDCTHCKSHGRSQSTSWHSYGRAHYYCEHPKAKQLTIDAFGNSAPCFIGFGDITFNSPLTVKTSPRWCPLRKEDHNNRKKKEKQHGKTNQNGSVPVLWTDDTD